MDTAPTASISEHFASLVDPRLDRTKPQQLLAILIIAICAIIGGADDGVEVELFGNAKLAWLRCYAAPALILPAPAIAVEIVNRRRIGVQVIKGPHPLRHLLARFIVQRRCQLLCTASSIFFSAWSMLKLAAFMRGGYSWKVARNSRTMYCAA